MLLSEKFPKVNYNLHICYSPFLRQDREEHNKHAPNCYKVLELLFPFYNRITFLDPHPNYVGINYKVDEKRVYNNMLRENITSSIKNGEFYENYDKRRCF